VLKIQRIFCTFFSFEPVFFTNDPRSIDSLPAYFLLYLSAIYDVVLSRQTDWICCRQPYNCGTTGFPFSPKSHSKKIKKTFKMKRHAEYQEITVFRAIILSEKLSGYTSGV
jgi:hypothetical protein